MISHRKNSPSHGTPNESLTSHFKIARPVTPSNNHLPTNNPNQADRSIDSTLSINTNTNTNTSTSNRSSLSNLSKIDESIKNNEGIDKRIQSPKNTSKRFSTGNHNHRRVISSNLDINKRRNALRDFYKLDTITKGDPNLENELTGNSEDEIIYDKDDFDEVMYVKQLFENKKIEDILKEENALYHDVRTLDSEQKALVYNNYYKLISAAESLHSVQDTLNSKITDFEKLKDSLGSICDRSRTFTLISKK